MPKGEKEQLIEEILGARMIVVYPPVINGPYSRIALLPSANYSLVDFMQRLSLKPKTVLKATREPCCGGTEYDRKSFQFLADTLGESLLVLGHKESGFKKKYHIFHSQESLFGRPIFWFKGLFWKIICRNLK